MTLITLNFNCLTAINEFRVPELSIKIHLIPSITAISHLPHHLPTSPALPSSDTVCLAIINYCIFRFCEDHTP